MKKDKKYKPKTKKYTKKSYSHSHLVLDFIDQTKLFNKQMINLTSKTIPLISNMFLNQKK